MLILEKTLRNETGLNLEVEKINNINFYNQKKEVVLAIKQKKDALGIVFNNLHKLYLPDFDKSSFEKLSVNELDLYSGYLENLIIDMNSIGFQLSQNTLEHIVGCSLDTLKELKNELPKRISNELGKRQMMGPLYSEFENKVKELHYSNNKLKFSLDIIDDNNVKLLELCDENDLQNEFIKLANSPLAYSENEKDLINIITDNPLSLANIPSNFNNKENMAYLFANVMNKYDIQNIKNIKVETATDVLRIAAGLSNNDISLSEKFKFDSFSNQKRKMLMTLLEKTNPTAEELNRHKTLWLKFGEKVHPSSYNSCPKSKKAFNILRNDKVTTFYGKLEKEYSEKNIDNVLTLLESRPGEFARHLNRTLSVFPNDVEKTVRKFDGIVDELQPKMLIELNNYFKNRLNDNEKRIFMIKGNTSKTFVRDNTLEEINSSIILHIKNSLESAFVDKMKVASSLGSVYISEDMKNFTVPTTNRDASSNLQSAARGSSFKLDNAENLRLFCHWVQPKDIRVDIDLSAVLFDKDFVTIKSISYMSLSSKEYGIQHSGDFRSAPKSAGGATEYIDINLSKIKNTNVKYVAVEIHSYSNDNFSELPECFAGIMKDPDELFDTKSVVNKSDITSESTQNILMVYDVEKERTVWLDLNIPTNKLINNIDTNKNSTINIIKSFMEKEFMSVYDLALLNAKARAIDIVLDKEKADTIIDVDGNITPYNITELLVPSLEQSHNKTESIEIVQNQNISVNETYINKNNDIEI